MSRPDATASTALEAEVVKPVWFGYFDFSGDPIRANTSGGDIVPSGSGDSDLDGQTFIGIAPDVVEISSVKSKRGGSDSVIATLSGIPTLDDVMTLIGDKSNWQGRPARLWRIVRDASNAQQGAFNHYYTGYMTAATMIAGGEGQTLQITVETYLAAFRGASNRTYLDQERYDSGDLSAKAAIAIANGNTGNPATKGTPTLPYWAPGREPTPYTERWR